MAEFDPDAFLKTPAEPAAGGGFDPDAFLKTTAAPSPVSQGGIDLPTVGKTILGTVLPVTALNIAQRIGPENIGRAVAETWENPPAGPSIIGAAKKAYHAFSDPLPAPRAPGLRREDFTDIPGESQPNTPLVERATDIAASTMLTSAGAAARRGVDPNTLGMNFAPRQTTWEGTHAPVTVSPTMMEQVVERAGNIDVPVPRYMVDENRMTQGLAAGLQNIPGAGDKIAKAATQTSKALGTASDRVREGYGTGSPSVAGSYAKDALVDWIETGSSKVASRVYDNVDKLINPDVTTPLSATAKAAQAILDRRAASRIPGKSATVEIVQDAIDASGGLTYQGIKGLRSYIGEMTPQEIVAQGLRAGEVKQLYAALTKDLRDAVTAGGGPEALMAFNRANTVYQNIANRREALTKIIGAKGDAAPEAVFSRLVAMAGSKSSADISRLVQARKVMGPEAWNEVAAGVVGKLGRDPQGEFSLQRFLTGYGNLSPQGRQMLFKSSGNDQHAKALEDIHFVSKQLEDKLKQFYNPSGTARSLVSTGTVMGILHSPIKTLSTLIGGDRLATVLSEPATARATAEWAKAYRDAVLFPHVKATRSIRDASEKLAGVVVGREGGNPQALALELQLGLPAPEKPRAAGGRVNAANIDPSPSDAQKQAGNYAKDHVRVHGLDIAIENAKGAIRRGVDRDGKSWSVKMPAHYGYIKGTVGKDKDHVDVYLGPHIKAPKVFVVDQIDTDSGKFDEHKCFLGFASKRSAIDTYHKAFSDGRGRERCGHVTEMSVDEFKHWLASGKTKSPLARAA